MKRAASGSSHLSVYRPSPPADPKSDRQTTMDVVKGELSSKRHGHACWARSGGPAVACASSWLARRFSICTVPVVIVRTISPSLKVNQDRKPHFVRARSAVSTSRLLSAFLAATPARNQSDNPSTYAGYPIETIRRTSLLTDRFFASVLLPCKWLTSSSLRPGPCIAGCPPHTLPLLIVGEREPMSSP